MAFAQTMVAGQAKPIKMVVLGDSLKRWALACRVVAAFSGAATKNHWKTKGIKVDMINCRGVRRLTASGGGRDRLDWSVPDGNRGRLIPRTPAPTMPCAVPTPNITRSALTDILTRPEGAQDRRAPVRDVGAAELWQRLPPPASMRIYPDLAKNPSACRCTRFFSWRASRLRPSSNQPDGMHPTAEGRGCHREKYSAHGGGISSRHDLRGSGVEKTGQRTTLSHSFFP